MQYLLRMLGFGTPRTVPRVTVVPAPSRLSKPSVEQLCAQIKAVVEECNRDNRLRGDSHYMEVIASPNERHVSTIKVVKRVQVRTDTTTVPAYYRVLEISIVSVEGRCVFTAVLWPNQPTVQAVEPQQYDRFVDRVCDHVRRWTIKRFEEKTS